MLGTLHASKGIGEEVFDSASLFAVGRGGEGQGVHGATGSDAGGHNVLVKLLALSGGHDELGVVHVRPAAVEEQVEMW